MADLRSSLSPHHYVDPDVFERERHTILRSSWLPMCRVDQIASPGDVLADTLLDEPLVATHSADGAIRVLSNVCPHRGSTVLDDGPGRASTLVCPYHRWAYRLDGTFVGAPLADGADLEGVCLTPVRHTVWEGFVLVNLSGDAADPAGDLAGLSDQIAPWSWGELVTVGTREFESTWNWKLMVENWIECYHHIGTHRETIEPIQPARTTEVIDSGGAPWAAMTVQTVEGLQGGPGEWIPGVDPERALDLSVWAAFPLLLGGSVSRYAFWLKVVPVDATHHRVRWYVLAHPSHLDRFGTSEVDAHMELICRIHVEDMETCARVQAGLASGRLDRFRLAPLEAPIADFQRWVSARLSAASS
jgi:phenylpropionate dioxygenase-like ring-hydroxylating dioxygenase large terminal subunit